MKFIYIFVYARVNIYVLYTKENPDSGDATEFMRPTANRFKFVYLS